MSTAASGILERRPFATWRPLTEVQIRISVVSRILLVLGAGASLANARYFRPERSQDTHPPLDTTFFQKIRVLDVPQPPALRTYLKGLLGVDPSPRLLEGMRMEEFFKDVYYDFVTEEDSVPTRRAYIDLVGVYTRVLRETTNWLCEDTRTDRTRRQTHSSGG
jgi:hypothetical protein